MSKSNTSKSIGAKKTQALRRPAQKRVRRVIFKTDQWYAGAVTSIGIAGRAKGGRASAVWQSRPDDDSE